MLLLVYSVSEKLSRRSSRINTSRDKHIVHVIPPANPEFITEGGGGSFGRPWLESNTENHHYNHGGN